ncbi:peptidoglycan D,D-transpeptidase FtsI family protein [Phytoactinopolyspora limicola]|uniref:peptidoglycan D,D-transpeptidase FtsI family protein n=1 Tax=Phytoactinopolyspora limicola TaxID=2715536 RepID=UPI00140D5D17|nr:penicillin-binding protein 2 [Phytoactinopolyspora limicola]
MTGRERPRRPAGGKPRRPQQAGRGGTQSGGTRGAGSARGGGTRGGGTARGGGSRGGGTRGGDTGQGSARAASGRGGGPRGSATRGQAAATRRTRPRPQPAPAPKPRRPARKKPPARLFRLADPRKRIKVLMVAGCVLLSLFAGRLVQLQGLDASTYAVTASQIGRITETLPADRGDILDRNGAPLAQAVEAYHVWVDQTEVTNPARYALQLEDILDDDAATLQEKLTGDRRYVYVAKSVSGSVWREIQALKLAGIGADNAEVRAYPAGAVGGSVIGFIGSDGTALAGLELSQDNQLAGEDGQVVYRRSPTGQRIPTGPVARQDPVTGSGLRLTIDRDLQWHAEQVLADAVDNARADGGVAVVLQLEPDAHEIVALASVPSVDPNDPNELEPADRGSRAVEEAYEPGSVFKPLTMAALIEEGVAGAESVYSVPDRIRRSGHTIRDYYNHPEQQMTLTGILAKSSNVGTLLATEAIGKDTFHEYLDRFGIGSATGIGLPAETSGRLPADMSDLTRDNVSFGQGVSVNAVQMASAYAAIANGGVRIDPTLISATIGADGQETPTEGAEPVRVVSEETAAEISEMMEAVMGEGGTGSGSTVDGYRVAGKTGTAQRIDPDCGCYRQFNSSFMGFAPADDPKYVVVVSVMNPRNGNSGSGLAGPAFADILRFALEGTGVQPSQEDPPRLPLFADEITTDDDANDADANDADANDADATADDPDQTDDDTTIDGEPPDGAAGENEPSGGPAP